LESIVTPRKGKTVDFEQALGELEAIVTGQPGASGGDRTALQALAAELTREGDGG
jgi:hypothetical protein